MLYIYLKSYNVNLLNEFSKWFLSKNDKKIVKGPIKLPSKHFLYTTIRSPHVYSLSRDQYGLSIHRQLFLLKPSLDYRTNTYMEDFALIESCFLKSIPAGISLKLSFKNK